MSILLALIEYSNPNWRVPDEKLVKFGYSDLVTVTMKSGEKHQGVIKDFTTVSLVLVNGSIKSLVELGEGTILSREAIDGVEFIKTL